LREGIAAIIGRQGKEAPCPLSFDLRTAQPHRSSMPGLCESRLDGM